MKKTSTFHYVLQNFPESTNSFIHVDELSVDFEGFSEVYEYLNCFSYHAPEKLVNSLLEKLADEENLD